MADQAPPSEYAYYDRQLASCREDLASYAHCAKRSHISVSDLVAPYVGIIAPTGLYQYRDARKTFEISSIKCAHTPVFMNQSWTDEPNSTDKSKQASRNAQIGIAFSALIPAVHEMNGTIQHLSQRQLIRKHNFPFTPAMFNTTEYYLKAATACVTLLNAAQIDFLEGEYPAFKMTTSSQTKFVNGRIDYIGKIFGTNKAAIIELKTGDACSAPKLSAILQSFIYSLIHAENFGLSYRDVVPYVMTADWGSNTVGLFKINVDEVFNFIGRHADLQKSLALLFDKDGHYVSTSSTYNNLRNQPAVQQIVYKNFLVKTPGSTPGVPIPDNAVTQKSTPIVPLPSPPPTPQPITASNTSLPPNATTPLLPSSSSVPPFIVPGPSHSRSSSSSSLVHSSPPKLPLDTTHPLQTSTNGNDYGGMGVVTVDSEATSSDDEELKLDLPGGSSSNASHSVFEPIPGISNGPIDLPGLDLSNESFDLPPLLPPLFGPALFPLQPPGGKSDDQSRKTINEIKKAIEFIESKRRDGQNDYVFRAFFDILGGEPRNTPNSRGKAVLRTRDFITYFDGNDVDGVKNGSRVFTQTSLIRLKNDPSVVLVNDLTKIVFSPATSVPATGPESIPTPIERVTTTG